MKKSIVGAAALGVVLLSGCASQPQGERFERENYEAYGNPVSQYYHPFSHLKDQATKPSK